MKRLILTALPVILTACSTPPQQATMPLDMQTVYDYQQRVATGQSNKQSHNKAEYWELNQSDKRQSKVIVLREPYYRPAFHPHFYHHRYGVGAHFHP